MSPPETVSGACTANSRLGWFGATSWAWPAAIGAVQVRRVVPRRSAWARQAPEAAPPPLPACWRHQRRAAARAVRATARRNIVRPFGLPLLLGFSLGEGGLQGEVF